MTQPVKTVSSDNEGAIAPSASKASLVVLMSGSGTNLQAIIDACENNKINGQISAVVSNKAGVYGLERAAKSNIPTHVETL